jgi:shikimate kinase
VTRADHLVLIGMMGVGKSTVGRRLAEAWSWPFVDTDDEIERRAGRTVAELFAAVGEDGFRRLESDVLADLLAADDPHVISCGGGVVNQPDNRDALGRRATVVWLTAPEDVLVRRLGAGRERPLLGDRPGSTLAKLMDERRPFYEEAADHVVDTTDRSVAVVAARIEQAVT